MSTYSLYQVDAFSHRVFGGNPAAVVPLDNWLPDDTLQQIATENNLSETAYLVPEAQGYRLRWFTPAAEVRLCGHATLASAHVLFQHLQHADSTIVFHTLSGPLTVSRTAEGYAMDFPADTPRPSELSRTVRQLIGLPDARVLQGKDDLLAILADEESVREIDVDFAALSKIPVRGLIVSAPGDTVDFVSRCFYPRYGISEDPVTGSAHCLLTPYWADLLNKPQLSARQLSARGGALQCTWHGERVVLVGQAVTYLTGTFEI